MQDAIPVSCPLAFPVTLVHLTGVPWALGSRVSKTLICGNPGNLHYWRQITLARCDLQRSKEVPPPLGELAFLSIVPFCKINYFQKDLRVFKFYFHYDMAPDPFQSLKEVAREHVNFFSYFSSSFFFKFKMVFFFF